MTGNSDQALVLFSGGQDSATCLAWALARFQRVETLAFDYGQRHAVELDCRLRLRAEPARAFPEWRPRLGADHLLEIPVIDQIGATALTQEQAFALGADGLPNTFVPGRNLLFLTLAGALAYRRGLRHLVGGMCETDYSGYPDCRDDSIKAMQLTLNLGMGRNFVIHTPLMWRNKAAAWHLAEALGGESLVALICEHSHSCYVGDRDRRHDWGYGCGNCPACGLRRQGYRRYREEGRPVREVAAQ